MGGTATDSPGPSEPVATHSGQGSSGTASPPTTATGSPPPAAIHTANGTYSTTATSAEVLFTGYSSDGPCLRFEGDIVNKVVTATFGARWNSSSPTTDSLGLQLITLGASDAQVYGPSPLNLTVGPFDVKDFFTFGLTPNADGTGDPEGAFVDLPLTLTWSIEYEGRPGVVPETSNC